ncbi:DEAD/DEAH box helicase [Sporosarcina koreensis]|uniref:DEAD/DEAH box helicase n=1 Tax=Sporosarcina koreensis TaxID=334735 RepID=UPI000B16DE5E|nr:SNF2-related protein [Sporosarcina koreensis]
MQIERSTEWKDGFTDRLENREPWDSWALYQLGYEAEQAKLISEFNGLQCTRHLPNLTAFPHQLEAAERVIERMNGKAILADEVGLGKTIEAGLILKEYLIRGLVKKALILAPASLTNQWLAELNTKFHIPAMAYNKKYNMDHCPIVVTSIDMAKRSPHREAISRQEFDLVIIDEAHKLKNPKTKNYEFVQQMKKKFCLLLTATPIQNDVFELFNLISLLKPGHLGNLETFQSVFSASKHHVEEDEFLRELIQQVMVRNVRGDTGIEWTDRHARIVPIGFSQEERDVYDRVSKLPVADSFTLLTLQRELCSSPLAAVLTLEKIAKETADTALRREMEQLLLQLTRTGIHSKAEKTAELIRLADDKVIVFTEYRATQVYLQAYLHKQGVSSVLFNGKFSKNKREWMKQLFQQKAQVLIATESGSEGLNLQFCHHVVNYDLPWNPMKLEQRIGRVHRLGQEQDVHIYNLAVEDSVEDKMVELLEKKIGVFETVVGELDHILSDPEKSIS